MPYPALSVAAVELREAGTDAAVLVLPPPSHPFFADPAFSALGATLTRLGFSGAPGAYVRADAPELFDGPLAVVGSGSSPDAAALRVAAGAGIRQLTGHTRVAVAAPAAGPGAALA
ncbi:MAG: leucyl aminopeptidase, partial [Microbacterium sp.]